MSRVTDSTLGAGGAWAAATWIGGLGLAVGAWAAPGLEDWPQWRGPDRNGVSTETTWTDEGREATLWSAEVGLGYSTVSVAEGRVYTTGHDEERGLDVVWCFDADSGEVLWTHTYPAEKWAQFHGGGTLTTPSVDGEVVYVLNREGLFSCLDAESGKVRWHQNVAKKHGLEFPTWGFAASPLVLDEMVVLNVGKVLAFEKRSGEPIWATDKSYGHAYSTPTDCELRGRSCLAVLGGDGLAILDRKSGKELGFMAWKTQYDVNAASPVAVGDDRLLVSSGYGHGAALFEFGEQGLKTLWETKKLKTAMATGVMVGRHVYGFDEAELKCFDLEGNQEWSQRGLGKGALSAAGDRLIVMSSKGELVIVSADPQGYQELSRTKVLDGGVCWSMPVLADGRIFCRNSKGSLVCRDHRRREDR